MPIPEYSKPAKLETVVGNQKFVPHFDVSISLYSLSWSQNHHNFFSLRLPEFCFKSFPHDFGVLYSLGKHPWNWLQPFHLSSFKTPQVTFRVIYYTTRLVLMSNGCPSFAPRPLFALVLSSVLTFWGKTSNPEEHLHPNEAISTFIQSHA